MLEFLVGYDNYCGFYNRDMISLFKDGDRTWEKCYKDLLNTDTNFRLIFNKHDFIPNLSELRSLIDYGHEIIIIPTSRLLFNDTWKDNESDYILLKKEYE